MNADDHLGTVASANRKQAALVSKSERPLHTATAVVGALFEPDAMWENIWENHSGFGHSKCVGHQDQAMNNAPFNAGEQNHYPACLLVFKSRMTGASLIIPGLNVQWIRKIRNAGQAASTKDSVFFLTTRMSQAHETHSLEAAFTISTPSWHCADHIAQCHQGKSLHAVTFLCIDDRTGARGS